MYEVTWVESALLHLAEAWTQSEPQRRAGITSASHRVDDALRTNPVDAGESRDSDRRIYIDLPLVVFYEVDLAQASVTVLDVVVSRRP
jgi:hypothetical protein